MLHVFRLINVISQIDDLSPMMLSILSSMLHPYTWNHSQLSAPPDITRLCVRKCVYYRVWSLHRPESNTTVSVFTSFFFQSNFLSSPRRRPQKRFHYPCVNKFHGSDFKTRRRPRKSRTSDQCHSGAPPPSAAASLTPSSSFTLSPKKNQWLHRFISLRNESLTEDISCRPH